MPAWPAGRRAVVVEPRPLVAGGDPVVGQGGGVLLSTVVQLFDIAVYRNDLQLSAPVGCRFERPKTAACVEPKPQNRRSL